MTKVEFLAMSLPSRLKGVIKAKNGNESTVEMKLLTPYSLQTSPSIHGFTWCECNKFKPIIRPMSALTEPCVQSDYNGGKPFEPHDELMKISVCDAEIKFVYTLLSNTHDRNRLLRFAPLTFVNLLIKWHFWPNMPEGESVVYVDDNFNPYK